jgi:hypothetical protein
MSVVKSGSGFKVVSKEGKPLSKQLSSLKEAAKRLAQVEHFKKKGK